jgi:polyhydroxybutyrate depolymerase
MVTCRAWALAVVGAAMGLGCSSREEPAREAESCDPEAEISADPLGGERSVIPYVPASYCHGRKAPLVIVLHGYGAGGLAQETVVFQFRPLAEELGFVYLYPDGTPDASRLKFWNATDACCNFGGIEVDDVAYLEGLIDEASERFSIDPKRVYFVGHSNGGFMSHRMACDRAGRVAAIASLAGSTFEDTARCQPSEPVAMLQIHGDADSTIPYAGGDLAGARFPGAEEIAARWRATNGCTETTARAEARDYDAAVAGAETAPSAWTEGCHAPVELWRMQQVGHIPSFTEAARRDIVAFLLAHEKP